MQWGLFRKECFRKRNSKCKEPQIGITLMHQRNSKAQARMLEAGETRRRGRGKHCGEVRGIKLYRTLTFAWVGWRAIEVPA